MRRLFAISCFVGLTAAACGQAPEDPPPAPAMPANPGPCDLLTPAEIRNVLGEEVMHGETNGFECTFTRPPDEVAMRRQAVKLRLEFGSVPPDVLMSNYQTTLRDALGEYNPAPISTIGDGAVWDGDTVASVVAINPGKSAFVAVQLSGIDESVEQSYATQLTTRAVANLKARAR